MAGSLGFSGSLSFGGPPESGQALSLFSDPVQTSARSVIPAGMSPQPTPQSPSLNPPLTIPAYPADVAGCSVASRMVLPVIMTPCSRHFRFQGVDDPSYRLFSELHYRCGHSMLWRPTTRNYNSPHYEKCLSRALLKRFFHEDCGSHIQ